MFLILLKVIWLSVDCDGPGQTGVHSSVFFLFGRKQKEHSSGESDKDPNHALWFNELQTARSIYKDVQECLGM